MRIAVVGLGKIGTALAAQYVSKGHVVVGCDINPRTVESINAGRAPMREEPGVQDLIAQGVAAGRLSATTDTTAAAPNAAMDDHWNGRAGDTWVELGRLLDQELHALGLEAQGALDLQPGECAANPLVNSAVTFRRAQGIPPIARRKNQTVGPIGVVRHKPARSWARSGCGMIASTFPSALHTAAAAASEPFGSAGNSVATDPAAVA